MVNKGVAQTNVMVAHIPTYSIRKSGVECTEISQAQKCILGEAVASHPPLFEGCRGEPSSTTGSFYWSA